MDDKKKPYTIDFPGLGESSIGFISVTQNGLIPFEIKRVFWTYYTPESIVRGRHSHYKTEQILVAVCGRIILTTESAYGEIKTFILEKPSIGVYIPPNVWHTMQYSHSSVQMVLASTEYEQDDYIRNHDEFKKVWTGRK
jgi:dTDP-4-dehydrorhamnose 3,5-epimerase-like enzyme